jgi:hypothetical protein
MAPTFSGETCTFGQGSVPSGWSAQFVQQWTGSSAVHFVPSFFVDTSQFNTYSGVINGMFNVSSSIIAFCINLIFLSGILDGQDFLEDCERLREDRASVRRWSLLSIIVALRCIDSSRNILVKSFLPSYVSPVRAERARGIFVYSNISDLDEILSYSEHEHVQGGRVRIV